MAGSYQGFRRRKPPTHTCRSCGRQFRSWKRAPDRCPDCVPADPLALVRADPFRPRRP